MSGWYVDKGLAKLISQLKEKFPGIVIGTIGDENHQGTTSDHNPEADGSVDAADPMLGKSFDKNDAEWLWATLRQYRDERIAYIIWNGQIVSSTVEPWKVRKYTGSDPHTGHLHISVNDKHENDTREWQLAGKKYTMLNLGDVALPALKYGMSDADYDGWNVIKRMQRILKVDDDGVYGPQTRDALKNWFDGEVDGKSVDATMWKSLYGITTI